MSTYLAQLGSFPELAFQELQAVVAQQATRVHEFIAQVELDSDQAAQELQDSLGGTVKIARVIQDQVDTTDLAAVAELIRDQAGDSKLHFGFAELNRDHLPKLDAQDIKTELQELGVKTRFVSGSRNGLSASVLSHQKKVREFLLINHKQGTSFAETVAIQNIDHWTTKDRGKPYADRKKGMLPPKVARMMLNLAVGTTDKDSVQFLDPFCGTGTVLIEAIDAGITSVFGSDADLEAVEGTRANLAWAQRSLPEYTASADVSVLASDATHLSKHNLSGITHIATEPFLGKQTPQPGQLPNLFTGLERLYLGAFKEWTKVLAHQATVVIVFPEPAEGVTVKNFNHTWQDLIDKIAPLGYTITSEPLLYARPGATIRRNIYQFRYTKPQHA